MRGLRKQENKKFENFFKLVQDEAAKNNSVFFLDCGQGYVFENDLFECEDMCGWLMPEAKADEFTPIFMTDSDNQHEFDDFYVYVGFKVNGDSIEIQIDDSPNDFIDELNLKNEVLRK